MNRRDFLGGLAAAGAAAALPLRSLGLERTEKAKGGARRPNILILQPDQHSAMVMDCNGNRQALTPHLDGLARESVNFRRAVSNSPVCCPWRASMQSGLYWHTNGIDRNNIRLNPELVCLADVLSAGGYATGYIGKWHLDGGIPKIQPGGYVPAGPRRQGWQDWHGYEKNHEYFKVWQFNAEHQEVPVPGYHWEPTWYTDMTLDFIKRQKDTGRPWCYYTAYGPPHKPQECKQEFLDRYDPASFILNPAQRQHYPDEARLRKVLQIYYGQVTAIDHEVGRVLKGLEDLGVADDTIVLYTSDHGDVLGWDGRLRGKSVPRRPAFWVPMFIRWPGKLAPRESDAVIVAPDIPATLVDLAGLDIPHTWQGRSFAPVCRGEPYREREGAYMGLHPWRAVWDGRYLYSEGEPHCLFDHDLDPFELENRLDDRRLVRQMQDKLRAVAIESGDPHVT